MDIEDQAILDKYAATPFEPIRGPIDQSPNVLSNLVYYPKSGQRRSSTDKTPKAYDQSNDGIYVPTISSQVSSQETGWRKSWKTFQVRARHDEALKSPKSEKVTGIQVVSSDSPDFSRIQWPSDRLKTKDTFSQRPLVRYVEPKIGMPGDGVTGLVSPALLSYDVDLDNAPSMPDSAIDHIQSWMERNAGKLDPYDPDNIRLIELMNKLKVRMSKEDLKVDVKKDDEQEQHGADHPKASGPNLTIGSLEDLMKTPRMRMIKMRADGVPHLKHVAIPLNDREVPLGLLTTHLSRSGVLSGSAIRGLESRREKAMDILREIGHKLLVQSQDKIDRPQVYEDLVYEKVTSGMEFAIDFFTGTVRKRPLHPVRKERKKVTLSSGIVPAIGQNGSGQVTGTSDKEVRLIITVMHAANVPVRTWAAEEERKSSGHVLRRRPSDIPPEDIPRVNPFVEVIFQKQVTRTSTAEGPQPTWNEMLDLSFRPPTDWSPTTLCQVKDSIFLNLYDEVILPATDTNPKMSPSRASVTSWSSLTSVNPRIERRWLGSMSIPFSSLYLNSRIEGTFALKTPITLNGYDYDKAVVSSILTTASAKSSLMRQRSEAMSESSMEQTLLTIFVTTDPLINRPEDITIKCDSDEDEVVLTISRCWLNEVKTDHPTRRVKGLAIDLSGKWVLVTRYLNPLRPPELGFSSADPSTLNMEDVMRRLARFVSLIPCIPDYSSTGGAVSDIWLTNEEFLDMVMGDEDEHSILLCNFFLFLGRRAGLVLGTGLPEGPTSYVIVWEYSIDDVSLWNPINGTKYSARDPFIPITSVGAIVTLDNVYANIQTYDHPTRVRFDVKNIADWKPLFTKKSPIDKSKLISVQKEVIEYRAVDTEEAKILQDRLENYLKSCLMRWRTRPGHGSSRTFFNRTCTKKMRKVMPKLEKAFQSRGTKAQVTADVKSLTDIQSMYQMTGFPLNMPFSDASHVAEAVFSTGVHMIDGPDVEFVLVVYIHPYPCSVLSVWVYVASLTSAK